MSFINWGHETPEQLKARKEMEDRMLSEQASFNAATAAAAAGSSRLKPREFVGLVDWLTVAPAGSGSNIEQDYSDFDDWTTASFTPLLGVKRLRIEADSANAHVHEDHQFSDLTIDLFNSLTSTWVTVWSHRLENPYWNPDPFLSGGSDDYFINGIDTTFPEIASVTKIRFTSDPGSDQTYHDWDQDSTIFRFYK